MKGLSFDVPALLAKVKLARRWCREASSLPHCQEMPDLTGDNGLLTRAALGRTCSDCEYFDGARRVLAQIECTVMTLRAVDMSESKSADRIRGQIQKAMMAYTTHDDKTA